MSAWGLNAKATLTTEDSGAPFKEAATYFQSRTEDVATDVKEAMGRGTSVLVTSPLGSSDTSTTTIPVAMLPLGNCTSEAKLISGGLKSDWASAEKAQHTRMVVRTEIDGTVFIPIRRDQILSGQQEVRIENLNGSAQLTQDRPQMRANLEDATANKSEQLDRRFRLRELQ
jgi:hypothetical protein